MTDHPLSEVILETTKKEKGGYSDTGMNRESICMNRTRLVTRDILGVLMPNGRERKRSDNGDGKSITCEPNDVFEASCGSMFRCCTYNFSNLGLKVVSREGGLSASKEGRWEERWERGLVCMTVGGGITVGMVRCPRI